jgi:transposase InsO family protein
LLTIILLLAVVILYNNITLLNREIFTTLTEAKVLIAEWRKEYNQVRPHSAKGYKPPAPEAKMIATLTL